MVRAAVKVVLPWSTWPMVPMLTWGFLRSNLPRAALTVRSPLRRRMTVVVAVVVRKGGKKEEERWVGVSFVGFEEKLAVVVAERVERGEAYGYLTFEEVAAAAAVDEIAIPFVYWERREGIGNGMVLVFAFGDRNEGEC